MVYSDKGLNKMSQTYHRLYRKRLMHGEWRDKARPILLNNWEATYFDFNEEDNPSVFDDVEDSSSLDLENIALDNEDTVEVESISTEYDDTSENTVEPEETTTIEENIEGNIEINETVVDEEKEEVETSENTDESSDIEENSTDTNDEKTEDITDETDVAEETENTAVEENQVEEKPTEQQETVEDNSIDDDTKVAPNFTNEEILSEVLNAKRATYKPSR